MSMPIANPARRSTHAPKGRPGRRSGSRPRLRLARAAILLGLALSGLTSARAPAQPQVGEPVLAGIDSLTAGHLARIDSAGKSHVIVRFLGSFPTAVTMARDNRNFLCALGTPPYPLLEVTPTGTAKTLAHLGQPAQWLDLDETGQLVAVAGSTRSRLFAVDLDLGTTTTLLATSAAPGPAGAMHLESGEVHFARRSPTPAALLRFDPSTRAVTTLSSTVTGTASGMAWDPVTGGTLFTQSGPTGAAYVAAANGGIAPLFSAPFARGVHVDEYDMIWVLTSQGAVNRIERRDRAGKTVSTSTHFAIGGTTGFTLYGSRTLHGRGVPREGSTYDLHVSVPGAAKRTYVLAASFRPRPALLLADGRRIRLYPDALFLLSLGGQIPGFRNFVGVLDASGQGRAAVDIPTGLAGFRFYFAGIRIDPQAPGQVGNVLNPIGMTVR